MTIDDYEGERVLISYAVFGLEKTVAARVCQIVFGRSKDRTPGPDERRAEGFIWRRGVVWIGQSVLVMLPEAATNATRSPDYTTTAIFWAMSRRLSLSCAASLPVVAVPTDTMSRSEVFIRSTFSSSGTPTTRSMRFTSTAIFITTSGSDP